MNEIVTLKAVSVHGVFERSQKIENEAGHVSSILGEKTVGSEHNVHWGKREIC